MRKSIWISGSLLAVLLIAVVVWWTLFSVDGIEHGELTRAELDLRDEVLYLKDSEETFTGNLIERYSADSLKLSIQIVDGRAHGVSHGWYENGQMEVEENFTVGVSNGVRTRWYDNGEKKSEATIVDGVIVGVFTHWYESGSRSAEVEMKDGELHGVALAWFPSGYLKSRTPYVDGVAGTAVEFADEAITAQSEVTR